MLNRYYKCENTKFIFQKWNIMVMIGIMIFVPVMVMTLDSFFGETGEMLCKSKLIQSFYLGQVGYTVLSALFFVNEYQKSALRTSLISTPDRRIFIITKFCFYTVQKKICKITQASQLETAFQINTLLFEIYMV